jgi:hypothetical protein
MLIDEAGPSTACRMTASTRPSWLSQKIKEISGKNQANGRSFTNAATLSR